VDGEPEEKNLYNQIERCTNLRFLYGKKNYRENNFIIFIFTEIWKPPTFYTSALALSCANGSTRTTTKRNVAGW
jgi:hypothetical protein